MAILFSAVFWFIGLIIGSLGLIQILIILCFSLPFTKKLDNIGVLSSKSTIIKRDFFTLSIWTIIITIVTLSIHQFASRSSFIAYCIGIGITLLLGLGKVGANNNNMQDYISSNKRFINTDAIENIKNENSTIYSLFQAIAEKNNIPQ